MTTGLSETERLRELVHEQTGLDVDALLVRRILRLVETLDAEDADVVSARWNHGAYATLGSLTLTAKRAQPNVVAIVTGKGMVYLRRGDLAALDFEDGDADFLPSAADPSSTAAAGPPGPAADVLRTPQGGEEVPPCSPP